MKIRSNRSSGLLRANSGTALVESPAMRVCRPGNFSSTIFFRAALTGTRYVGASFTNAIFSEADLAGRARGESVRRYLVKGAPALAALDAVVAQTGASHAQVALAWINAQPGIGAPLASATSAAQVRELCAAASLQLSSEHLALLTTAA